MRVLVTGGYGFMGSWIVEHLASQGHELYILSRSDEDKEFISQIKPVFLKVDLGLDSVEELIRQLPDNLDACIHTASLNDSFVPGYAEKALKVNVRGTWALLEAMRQKYKNPPLSIYASTFHVYGKPCGKVDEDTPLTPRSDYAISHAMAEEYFRFYYRVHELPSIILRSVNGYGTPKCLPFGKWYLLFHDLCKTAFEDGQIVLESPGNIERDFIWMGDVAGVMGELIKRPDLAGKVFNLSTGTTMSIKKVAELIAQEASQNLETKVDILEMSEPYQEENSLFVDNSALVKALDYKFTNRVSEEAKDTFHFLNEHP